MTDVVRLQGTDEFVETVPMLDDDGHMTPTDVERQLDIDIAVRWGIGYETKAQSYVNIIATPKGGTHVAGFERGMGRAFVAGHGRTPDCSRRARRSPRTTSPRD